MKADEKAVLEVYRDELQALDAKIEVLTELYLQRQERLAQAMREACGSPKLTSMLENLTDEEVCNLVRTQTEFDQLTNVM